MKKTVAVLLLIICLGVVISCKKTDNADYNFLITEFNAKNVFIEAENVFIGEYLEYSEKSKQRKEYLDVKVSVIDVYKGKYMPGETVNIEIQGVNVGAFKSAVLNFENTKRFVFFVDEKGKQINTPIEREPLKVLKVMEGGSILNAYMGNLATHGIHKNLRFAIPLNTEMLLQEVFEYKPLVNYLKDNLNTTGVGVLTEAKNVFIGEIQSKSGQFTEYNDYSGKYEPVGEKVGDIKANWEAFDGIVYEMQLYKVKAKVLNVYKGDYKPGDIVDAYVFMRYGESPSPEYMSEQLFIDGEGFFQ